MLYTSAISPLNSPMLSATFNIRHYRAHLSKSSSLHLHAQLQSINQSIFLECTVLEQAARQRHVSQFVVGFPAATETHFPAVIPRRHYHVTFLNRM